MRVHWFNVVKVCVYAGLMGYGMHALVVSSGMPYWAAWLLSLILGLSLGTDLSNGLARFAEQQHG